MTKPTMINFDKLYEFFDTTDVLYEEDVLDLMDRISDNDCTIRYEGEFWDFKEPPCESYISMEYKNEKEYHVENYDEKYKSKTSYQNAMSVGYLYDLLGELLKQNRLHRDEKLVISTKSIPGFANEFHFDNEGFPLIKEICG